MGGYEAHLCFMLFLDNYVQRRETSFFFLDKRKQV